MANPNRFVIHNEIGGPMTLVIEPEGAFFPLGDGQEVWVTDHHDIAPVTLKISRDEGGGPMISIWPGDGEVKVEKDGLDLLDLLEAGDVKDPSSALVPANGTPPDPEDD